MPQMSYVQTLSSKLFSQNSPKTMRKNGILYRYENEL
jgi:hypothetical protein